ncbi:MAG: hypothetical protein O2960_16155 [Verrucomicrobia bacterium]|nr:hypothetical protein [Verrucomicrobiota bacterium]
MQCPTELLELVGNGNRDDAGFAALREDFASTAETLAVLNPVPARIYGADALAKRRVRCQRAEERFAQAVSKKHVTGFAGVLGFDLRASPADFSRATVRCPRPESAR